MIFGLRADPDSPLKSSVERAREMRALKAIAEYRLITSGAATYAQLGYCDDRGRVPLYKLLEFLAVHEEHVKAENEKHGNH